MAGNLEQNLSILQSLPANFCLDGKSPNSLNNKEYLKAFSKGPCNPSVILPGLLGIKLMVTIDCEELKQKNSAIFSQCGWTDCTKHFYEVSYLLICLLITTHFLSQYSHYKFDS